MANAVLEERAKTDLVKVRCEDYSNCNKTLEIPRKLYDTVIDDHKRLASGEYEVPGHGSFFLSPYGGFYCSFDHSHSFTED